jgi:hypothetical protein
MSKSKSNGVATIDAPKNDVQLSLLQVDFDSIESIETVETEPVQEAAPAADLIEDSEEQILSTVESFDAVYGKDPLAPEWEQWGKENKAHTDNTSDAIFYIGSARVLGNLAVKERNLAPNSYDRAAFMKKAENVLRLCQVPESMVRPNEWAGIFGLVMLDCSTPSADPSEPRSFNHSIDLDEWVQGNLTMGVLRLLVKVIDRPSKSNPNELDTWEYKDGYEDWTRSMIKRLRAGELSVRQIEKLMTAKKKALADDVKRKKYASLTPADIATLEEQAKNKSLEVKLGKLAQKALDVQDFAANELKKGGAELRDFLVNHKIIPPNIITPQEYAAQMTPGDAKAMVQELVRLYSTKPDRLNVFRALYGTCKAVVDQIKSAQESAKLKASA